MTKQSSNGTRWPIDVTNVPAADPPKVENVRCTSGRVLIAVSKKKCVCGRHRRKQGGKLSRCTRGLLAFRRMDVSKWKHFRGGNAKRHPTSAATEVHLNNEGGDGRRGKHGERLRVPSSHLVKGWPVDLQRHTSTRMWSSQGCATPFWEILGMNWRVMEVVEMVQALQGGG